MSQQQQQQQSTTPHKRTNPNRSKSTTQAHTKTAPADQVAPADFTFEEYLHNFNLFAHRAKAYDAKSKNPELFSWRHTIQPYTKILVNQDTLNVIRRLESPVKKVTVVKQTQQDPSTSSRTRTSENQTARTDASNSFKQVSSQKVLNPRRSFFGDQFEKDKANAAQQEIRSSSVPRQRLGATTSLRKIPVVKTTKISDYDFSTPAKPRRTYSMTRLQTDELQNSIQKSRQANLPRVVDRSTDEGPKKFSGEEASGQKPLLMDPFQKTNLALNRILSQIEPNKIERNQRQTMSSTIEKIRRVTNPYKRTRRKKSSTRVQSSSSNTGNSC